MMQAFVGAPHRRLVHSMQQRPPPSAAATRPLLRVGRLCITASTKGGVADKQQTGVTSRSSTRRPPIYRVMLHNDDYNKREYVVKVLIKVVEGMKVDDAIVVMQEAHNTGVAMVRACPQDEAELCCEALRISGLSASIEPGC